MKYAITGSTGHISKPIIESLLAAGHEVTVITSKHDRQAEIESLGATAAVGSIENTEFLKKAFKGAHAVYAMIPPIYQVKDWKAYIGQVAANYAEAIAHNQIKYVVSLSSIGAHMPDGCGPVSGLYRAEQALGALSDVNIKFLRPAYFYYNLLNNINMVKNMGIIGGNFAYASKRFPIVDTSDIATAAIDELMTLNFSGHSVQYLASDETSTDEVASVIGAAIGKPDLKWVVFTDEQALAGGIQAGLPEEIAKNYAEMGHAANSGQMTEDYWKNHPARLGKIKLADFAKTFASAYAGNAATAH